MRILLAHNFYRQGLIGGEDLVFRREAADLAELLGTENVFQYHASTDKANAANVLVNIFFSFWHFWKIFFLVKRKKIDIVHCHNFFPLFSTSFFFAAKMAGAVTVHTLHNYRFWCAKGTFFRDGMICMNCLDTDFGYDAVKYKCFTRSRSKSLLAATAFWLYKHLHTFRYIDHFFVLTEFQRDFFLSRSLVPATKLVVKPNYFQPATPVSGEKIIDYDLIFVGRLEESKGLEYLLKIIAGNPGFKIAVIGAAPDYHGFQLPASDNLAYYPALSNAETVSMIGRSRYLVQLSLWFETFGLTIIEAMSVGTPVLGFPIGTRKDFIVDGHNGFFLNPDTINDDIRRHTAMEKDAYLLLTKNCRDFALQYDRKVILSKQVELYGRFLDHKTKTHP